MSQILLYGVGVGPGAPDLLTLRAVNVLESADVLALPRSSDFGESMAWRIIRPVIGERPGQERLFLTFPMSKDPQRLRPALETALGEIGARIEQGKTVAFATEGDPSLFSTFIYLQREAVRRWPHAGVEVVPGVSSLSAVAAVTRTPLADGQERIAILPANYGQADVEAVLDAFDTTIFMKIGSEMPAVVRALESRGLVDRAVYVSRATMAEQKVVRDVRSIRDGYGDCFAMLLVARRDRSGVLIGEASSSSRGFISTSACTSGENADER